jgi:hypothetical protein
MSCASKVALPEAFRLDGLIADGANKFSGVGVQCMRVIYPARSALLPQQGANIGHFVC